MILVLGPNPAIQKTITLPSLLVPDEVHRATSVSLGVGGKGQNVAIALHQLLSSDSNQDEVELHQFGSSDTTGSTLTSLLPPSLQASTTSTSTPVRTCMTLLTPDGKATEIIEPTPPITSDEIKTYLMSLSSFLTSPPSTIICMGSVPPSTPSDFYGSCVLACSPSSTSTIIIDVSSLPLLLGLFSTYLPPVKNLILKCNLSEVTKMCGSPEKAFEISNKLTHVVLTNGGSDATFIERGQLSKSVPIPPVSSLKSAIGAGDCVAAGLAFGIENGMTVEDAFTLGLKLGAASCQVPSSSGYDEAYFNALITPT
ncbi:hypothetical protein TrST_g13310 [Triparma strigata]|uniref:Carbohydrate kinase PfkB domain-containing protein n=1 Tax=Triparma strigata TaxID=1606541 RepID=A0A9W7DW23_9STRA|nr:hypothetical protein TrST_g13310 [Triparma strigata]